jgi:hypothetical protein
MGVKNLLGIVFGRLTVIEDNSRSKQGNVIWKCKCECGNEVLVNSSYLITGTTRSCGCLKKEESIIRFTTHGKTRTRLYTTWSSMNQRCYDQKCKSYSAYGGKGVTICDEWKSFVTFQKWAEQSGYNDELTIDRKDSTGNYCPENCQWISFPDNREKHRNSIMLSHDGEVHPLKTWCDKLGLPVQTVRRYYQENGKDLTEQNLSICIKSGNKRIFSKRFKIEVHFNH